MPTLMIGFQKISEPAESSDKGGAARERERESKGEKRR